MEKSRTNMVLAACLSFFSQFFNYASREFIQPITDMNLNYHGGSLTPAETGWDFHHWYSGAIIILVGYVFYTKSRPLSYYITAFIILLALGIGSDIGGTMGFIAAVTAGYAMYLKNKENKLVKSK